MNRSMIINLLIEYLERRGISYSRLSSNPDSRDGAARPNSEMDIKNLARAALLNIDQNYSIVALLPWEDLHTEGIKKHLKAREVELASHYEGLKVFPDCDPEAIPLIGSIFGLRVYCSLDFIAQDRGCFSTGTRHELITMSVKDFVALEKPIIGPFTLTKPET